MPTAEKQFESIQCDVIYRIAMHTQTHRHTHTPYTHVQTRIIDRHTADGIGENNRL